MIKDNFNTKLNKRVKLGNYLVGKDCKPFIIAEAGLNHNGDINLAKKLIIHAKSAGCDAVKFQTLLLIIESQKIIDLQILQRKLMVFKRIFMKCLIDYL